MSTVVVEELFEAGASQAPVGPAARPAGEEKCFRRYDPDQVLLMAPSIQEWVPEGHLARFVSDLATWRRSTQATSRSAAIRPTTRG